MIHAAQFTEASAWFGAGGICGYLINELVNAGNRIPVLARPELQAGGRTVRSRHQAIIGVAILAVVVVSVVLSAMDRASQGAASRSQAAYESCQAAYNVAVAQTIRQRAAFSDQDRRATTTLIRGVFTPAPGLSRAAQTARVERLYAAWNTAEQRYTSELAAAKFPSLVARCGPVRQR